MSTTAGARLIAHDADRASRSRWRSAGVSLACLLLGLLEFCVVLAMEQDEHGETLPSYVDNLLLWDLLIGTITCLATGPMHRAGRWNYLLVVAAGVSGMATPAACVAAIRLGGRWDGRDTAGVMVTALVFQAGVSTLLQAPADGFAWSDLLTIPVVAAVTWGCVMWGRSRADRVALIATLRTNAAAAQREREAVARQNEALARSRDADLSRTRADERTAIARDMHDSLSHHLSLIAMHAGALAYREDMPPETMRATARTLRDAAEAANTELRDVLSALRSPEGLAAAGDGASTTPLATVGDMRESIARARRSGQGITTTFTGLDEAELMQLPPTAAAALDRIVGELVVNAAKHAPGATLHLGFSHPDDHLVVRATNPRRGAGSAIGAGLGLVGITERARLLGGDATVDDSTDFTVEVHIPWRR